MRRRATLALLTALLPSFLACGPELNPPHPPPSSAQLAGGGVWIAYNLGCDRGCEEIRRGDRILAVDGRPVASGAELDALGLARGTPVTLRVARYKSGALADVTIVARPRDDMPPLQDAPPMWTVGAAALDRAPEWARERLFGHAIPAMRMHLGEGPRGFVNGRQLHGRGAVIVVWEMPWLLSQARASWDLLPDLYARMQAQDAALREAGVDTLFVFPSPQESSGLRADADPGVASVGEGPGVVRKAISSETLEHMRSRVPAGAHEFIPVYQLDSDPDDPNVVGLEHQAADIREWLFDRIYAPVVLVIDRRGIVRFHARDWPIGPEQTIDAAIAFALHDLADVPAK